MNCPHCFQHVPDESAFCPYCGARIGEPEPGALPEAVEDPTYGALAHANLLRLRGDWSAAREKTVEVLREYPNSGTAHSLMGDIFADQEMYEDAAQWYRMALDLEPDNIADERKLATVEARLNEVPAPPEEETEAAPPAVSGFRVAAWAAGAFLALVIVLGLWLQKTAPEPRPQSAARVTPQASDRPTSVAPAPQTPATPGMPDTPRAAPPAAVAPPAVAEPSAPGADFGETQRETNLRASLEGLGPGLERIGLLIAEPRVDPRTQSVSVTLDGSGVNGTASGWMEAVYNAALSVASTLLRADPALHHARVRVVMPLALPDGVSRETAFIGEAARPPGFDTDPRLPLSNFDQRWWHPGLAPPPAIATTP